MRAGFFLEGRVLLGKSRPLGLQNNRLKSSIWHVTCLNKDLGKMVTTGQLVKMDHDKKIFALVRPLRPNMVKPSQISFLLERVTKNLVGQRKLRRLINRNCAQESSIFDKLRCFLLDVRVPGEMLTPGDKSILQKKYATYKSHKKNKSHFQAPEKGCYFAPNDWGGRFPAEANRRNSMLLRR